jgi:transposase InsO family protein
VGPPSTPTPATVGDTLDTRPIDAVASGEPQSTPTTAIDVIEPTIARLRERAAETTTASSARRGSGHQQQHRDDEQLTRTRVAEAGRRLFDVGWNWSRIADLFQVAGRTLRNWCRNLLDRVRRACPLGRPVVRSPRGQRNDVIHFLDEFGPQIGVPTLRECFPAMCRAELDDLLQRYRRVWREHNREPLRILHWLVPGRVWAIDYAEAPAPIDGHFGYLLAVRDLATGMPLLWRPYEAPTADNAAAALAGLFTEHGPPLALKSDNGSHFTGGDFPALLAAHQVEHLLSPPYWPRYNGAIEAGIHGLKDRTAARAARAGHPGYWTWDDAAGARVEAAELARPHGSTGPSPAAYWHARTPIPADERAAFAAAVQRQIACETPANGVWSEREMAREAIRLTLEERGYLQYRRRRILPPISGQKVANNP